MSFSLLSPLVWDDAEFSQFFPQAAARRGGGAQQGQPRVSAFPPRMDIIEKGDKMILALELPGVKKEAVDLSLHNQILTISGNLPPEVEKGEGVKIRLQERRTGSFERSIRVPTGLKSDEIKASMNDGVLMVEYPSQPKEGETKKIAVS